MPVISGIATHQLVQDTLGYLGFWRLFFYIEELPNHPQQAQQAVDMIVEFLRHEHVESPDDPRLCAFVSRFR